MAGVPRHPGSHLPSSQRGYRTASRPRSLEEEEGPRGGRQQARDAATARLCCRGGSSLAQHVART